MVFPGRKTTNCGRMALPLVTNTTTGCRYTWNVYNYHVEVINCKLNYNLLLSTKFYLVFVEKSSKKKLPVNLNCFSLQLQIVIILWFISEAWFPTICKHYLSFSTFRDNNTCCCWKTNSIVSTDEYYQYTPYN